MTESWSNRLAKKAIVKIAETFPSWSGSRLMQAEGGFLWDEMLVAQTVEGIMAGQVVVKEAVWNRYLGRIADPSEEFSYFGIRLLPEGQIDLELKFATYGLFMVQTDFVSLVHNSQESALVLRYKSHNRVAGNLLSKILSWVVSTFGIKFCYRFYQVAFGSAVRISQTEDLFRIDFRKALWKGSFARPLLEGKSILDMIQVESAVVKRGEARLITKQKGNDLLEKLGFWVNDQTDLEKKRKERSGHVEK